MKIMRKSAIALLIPSLIILTGCNEKSADIGFNTENGVYTNEFFGMTIKLPDDWHVVNEETKEAIDVNNSILLMVAKYIWGSDVDSNPNLIVTIESIKHLPVIKKGRDFLYLKRKVLEISQTGYSFKDVHSEKIGPVEFDVQKVEINSGTVKIHQELYTSIMRGYALSFIMTWQQEEEKDSLKEILSTLTFRIAQNITFGPLADKTYDDKPFTISAVASSGLPVIGIAKGNCTLKGNQVTLTGVGRCKITALQEGNANYKAAKSIQDFNIGKRNQKIAFKTLADKTYGDKPFTISASISSGLPISGYATGNCTLNGNQVTLTGVGRCKITALQEGNANYKAAESVIQHFNILE
ncbi:MAG: hypothetical protein KAI83_19180 [Thiomargarita sp.]|nr:hypothetical protein [Thiomargarita sp.]